MKTNQIDSLKKGIEIHTKEAERQKRLARNHLISLFYRAGVKGIDAEEDIDRFMDEIIASVACSRAAVMLENDVNSSQSSVNNNVIINPINDDETYPAVASNVVRV